MIKECILYNIIQRNYQRKTSKVLGIISIINSLSCMICIIAKMEYAKVIYVISKTKYYL